MTISAVVKESDICIERLELGPYGTNGYIVVCPHTRESVLVDAPAEAGTILKQLKNTTPKYILMTHDHMDHVGALREVKADLKVPLAAHPLDAGGLPLTPDIMLTDGDSIAFGRIKLEVIHTPGHTPGSLCLRTGQYLISGDTIFPGGPGRTGSPAAFRLIVKSLTEKVFKLPDDTYVFPGHGNGTILKKEKDEFSIFASRPHKPDLCGDVLWLTS